MTKTYKTTKTLTQIKIKTENLNKTSNCINSTLLLRMWAWLVRSELLSVMWLCGTHTMWPGEWQVYLPLGKDRSQVWQRWVSETLHADDYYIWICSDSVWCSTDCSVNRYGPDCALTCECENGSQCDSRNGRCVCVNGWIGLMCSERKVVLIFQLYIV